MTNNINKKVAKSIDEKMYDVINCATDNTIYDVVDGQIWLATRIATWLATEDAANDFFI